MNRCLLALALAAVFVPNALATPTSDFLKLGMVGKKNEMIPGYLKVKFRLSAAQRLQAGSATNAAKYVSQIPNSGWTLWSYSDSQSYDEAAAQFRTNPNVITVEPLNRIYPMLTTPNDPDWGYTETDPTYILNFGESDPTFQRLWHLDDINAFNGWSHYPNTWYTGATKSTTAPLIAIVDTGCDMNHPDFMNSGATSTNVPDGGQLQKSYSKQFHLGEVYNAGSPEDHNGHGTHVAGLALAAGNNGAFDSKGTIGTGYMCRGMILRVFDNSGSGTDFDAAGAMYYAADKKAAVINLSLGTENYSQLFQDATTYCFQKGSLVVAAGNEDGSGGGDLGPIYPAGCSGALGVTANGPNQYPASGTYSGYGSYVDIAAPGGDFIQDVDYFLIQYVWSTSMRTRGDLEDLSDQGVLYPPYMRNYTYLAGTSMASPIVAGAAGAYMGWKNLKQGRWNNVTAYKALEKTADGVIGAPYGGWEPNQGYGSLNMDSLLSDSETRGAEVGSAEGLVYTNATAIANVAVRAQKLNRSGVPTGFTYTTTTNQHGYYRFDALPPATYQIRSAPNGQLKNRNVIVEVGCDTTGLDFWCGTYTGDDSAPDADALGISLAKSNKVRIKQFAWDTETGIDSISYRIGTTAGSANVVPDTELYTRTYLQDLKVPNLTVGNTYYLTVKYTNGAGLTTSRQVSFVVTP